MPDKVSTKLDDETIEKDNIYLSYLLLHKRNYTMPKHKTKWDKGGGGNEDTLIMTLNILFIIKNNNVFYTVIRKTNNGNNNKLW